MIDKDTKRNVFTRYLKPEHKEMQRLLEVIGDTFPSAAKRLGLFLEPSV
jgi:hypothetical protein